MDISRQIGQVNLVILKRVDVAVLGGESKREIRVFEGQQNTNKRIQVR